MNNQMHINDPQCLGSRDTLHVSNRFIALILKIKEWLTWDKNNDIVCSFKSSLDKLNKFYELARL
jgi:hypothetical protein